MNNQKEKLLMILYDYKKYDYDIWLNIVGAGLKSKAYGYGIISDVEIERFGVLVNVNFSGNENKKFNLDSFRNKQFTDLERTCPISRGI